LVPIFFFKGGGGISGVTSLTIIGSGFLIIGLGGLSGIISGSSHSSLGGAGGGGGRMTLISDTVADPG